MQLCFLHDTCGLVQFSLCGKAAFLGCVGPRELTFALHKLRSGQVEFVSRLLFEQLGFQFPNTQLCCLDGVQEWFK